MTQEEAVALPDPKPGYIEDAQELLAYSVRVGDTVADVAVRVIASLLKTNGLPVQFENQLPDGTIDTSTYGDVEVVLDRIGADVMTSEGKWLTLPERIATLIPDGPAITGSYDDSTHATRTLAGLKRLADDGYRTDWCRNVARAAVDIIKRCEREVPTQVADDILDRVGDAIHEAGYPEREGPYGLFDYTGYDDPLPHHVRDFRRGSPTYGISVLRSADREEAERTYEMLTRRHLAKAAIDAYRAGISNE